jgi:hypothetical protein
MLSFFEMCNLLQKQREKLLGISEAGEFLKRFGPLNSDTPEQAPAAAPAAPAAPAAKPRRTKKANIIPTSVSGDAPTPSPYSKEKPHPNHGQISFSGYRVGTGEYDDNGNEIERPMTPEEIQKMQGREQEERNKQIARRAVGSSGAEAEARKEALEAQRKHWDNLKAKVEEFSKRTKDPAKIAQKIRAMQDKMTDKEREELGIGNFSVEEVQDALDSLSVQLDDPFAVGSGEGPIEDKSSTWEQLQKDAVALLKDDEGNQRSQKQIASMLGVSVEDVSDAIASAFTGDTETIKSRLGQNRKIRRDADENFVTKADEWNNFLSSPAYQEFTKMASESLELGYKFPPPGQRFQISLDQSKGATSGPVEIVMSHTDFMNMKRFVEKQILGFKGEIKDNISRATDYRTALASKASMDPANAPLAARALQFESRLLREDIAGKKYTIKTLADTLASVAKKGGLNIANMPDDVEVVRFMIETSKEIKRLRDIPVPGRRGRQGTRVPTVKITSLERNPDSPSYIDPDNPRRSGSTGEIGPEKMRLFQSPFDFFAVEKGANLNDPNTTVYVKSVDEISKTDTRDDEGGHDRYTSNRDRVLGKKEPRTEATEWIDLMNLMEYWDK